MAFGSPVIITISGVQGSGKTTIFRIIEKALEAEQIAIVNEAVYELGACKDKPLNKCIEGFKASNGDIRMRIETTKPPPIDLEKYECHQVIEEPVLVEGARSPHHTLKLAAQLGTGPLTTTIQGLLMHHVIRDSKMLFLHARDIKIGDRVFIEKGTARRICIN